MATLLIVIFICYVGLGLPDSVLGAAWPAIFEDLNLPISMNGYISVVVSVCTIISSLFAAKFIRKFGTGWVTAISTLFTTVALLGFTFTQNPFTFFLFAVPLGLGAGAIDTGLNAFVAMNCDAGKMSFLHGSYGVGVALSPFIMSLALGTDGDWRKGYFIVSCIQLFLTIVAFAALPLWKKIEGRRKSDEAVEQKAHSLFEVLKMRGVRLSCFVFFSQCAIELTVGMWISSFFVESKGVSESSGAGYTMLFYIGLTVGRFLSGFFTTKIGRRKVLKMCITVLGGALVLFALPLPTLVCACALFLMGVSIGPTYPNMMHLTPKFFGEELAPSVIGAQQSLTGVGILLMPWLFGVLADTISMDLMPYYLLALFVVYVYSFYALLKEVKKKKNKK